MLLMMLISLSLLSIYSVCMAYSSHGFIKPSSSHHHHHQQQHHNHASQHNRRGSVYHHPFPGSTFMSLSSPSSSLSSPEASTPSSPPSSSVTAAAATHIVQDASDKHRIVSHNGVHTLSFNVAGKEFQFETGQVLLMIAITTYALNMHACMYASCTVQQRVITYSSSR